TLYDAYASTSTFRADVDITIDTRGKILINGNATFASSLSVKAYFFADLTAVQSGAGKFLFLLDMPGGAARSLGGTSIYGELTFEFLQSFSAPPSTVTDQFNDLAT